MRQSGFHRRLDGGQCLRRERTARLQPSGEQALVHLRHADLGQPLQSGIAFGPGFVGGDLVECHHVVAPGSGELLAILGLEHAVPFGEPIEVGGLAEHHIPARQGYHAQDADDHPGVDRHGLQDDAEIGGAIPAGGFRLFQRDQLGIRSLRGNGDCDGAERSRHLSNFELVHQPSIACGTRGFRRAQEWLAVNSR